MPGKKLFYAEKEFRADLVIDHSHQRLLVVDYEAADERYLCRFLWKTARENNVGKILFPVRPYDLYFLNTGQFVLEGYVDGFFCGVPGCFLAGFPEAARATNRTFKKEQRSLMEILSNLERKEGSLPPDIKIEEAKGGDPSLEAILKGVLGNLFLFPEKKKIIFTARQKGKVIAAAAAALSNRYKRAEITAFLSASTGQTCLGVALFSALLNRCRQLGFKYFYGLAPASSLQENHLFHQAGFLFRGTLVNNSLREDRLENTNLWVFSPTRESPGGNHPAHPASSPLRKKAPGQNQQDETAVNRLLFRRCRQI